ncbi:hypothetical protein PVBG_04827 [Plasmodium vivax Brazil I]|uniref:PIR Superfamily Protein n=1 Tax=Plasmodium vivax (strain Brazil I) TaxID=1033975 RepID=A0A0J9VN87_PLAV1|nr:hypothetical protein PVBG_04827 [Plasmodium vivax Brazil I]
MIDTDDIRSSYADTCKKNFESFSNSNDLESVCAKFKYFYYLLFGIEKGGATGESLEKFDEKSGLFFYGPGPWDNTGSFNWVQVDDIEEQDGHSSLNSEEIISINNFRGEFMNFWLNNQLKNKNIAADVFYEKLMSKDELFDRDKKLKDNMHRIDHSHLERMNILYGLYDSYISLLYPAFNEKNSCGEHSNQCFQKYNKATKICFADRITEFCVALKVFKNKYDQIKDKNMLDDCNKRNILNLPFFEIPPKDYVLTSRNPPQNVLKTQVLTGMRYASGVNLRGSSRPQGTESRLQAEHASVLENHNDGDDDYYYINRFSISGTILGVFFISLIVYKVN